MSETPMYRTPHGVLKPDGDTTWGTTIHEAPNPDGQPIPEGILDAIRLPANFVRIPNAQFGAWLDLSDYVIKEWDLGTDGRPDTTMEATVVHVRRDERADPKQPIWRTLAPTCVLGAAKADFDYTLPVVDIVTGEKFDSLQAVLSLGYRHSADTHSHGYIGAFHSATDDADDLRQPGLHMVTGNIDREGGTFVGYDMEISIVRRGRRYFNIVDPVTNQPRKMVLSDFVEPDENGEIKPDSFHQNVLEVMSRATKPAFQTSYQRQPFDWEKARRPAHSAWMDRQGSLGFDDEDDASVAILAALDALKASFPAASGLIVPLRELAEDYESPYMVQEILRSLNDADTLAALSKAHEQAALDI